MALWLNLWRGVKPRSSTRSQYQSVNLWWPHSALEEIIIFVSQFPTLSKPSCRLIFNNKVWHEVDSKTPLPNSSTSRTEHLGKMAFSWYPGTCTKTFTHAEEPLILPTKDGPDRALPELCNDVTPDCNLNPFLFNGHLQTAWTGMKPTGPKLHYKRRTFESEDSKFKGHFVVDFVTAPPPQKEGVVAKDGGPEDEGLKEDPMGVGHYRIPPRTTYFTDKEFENIGSDDTKPLLITLHGLSGGSYEVYLRHVLAPLVAQTPEGEKAGGLSGGDWEALVVNSRGCAGAKITTSILYNARATWDVRQVVKWCRKTWPKRPLFGIGFSLGANILTNVCSKQTNLSIANHQLNCYFLCVVPRRRRRQLPPLRRRCRVQSLETRSLLPRPPAYLARPELLQQVHGYEHAQAFRDTQE